MSPGARRSEVVGRLGDAWKLRVRSAPERGRANDEVSERLETVMGTLKEMMPAVPG